jgi:hypothetical protein
MSTVSTRALKDQLSSFLQRAESGERIEKPLRKSEESCGESFS